MIVDSIENASLYNCLNKSFPKVFEILASLDKNAEEGKIVIDEGNVWVNVQHFGDKAPSADPKFEEHRNFIDIHYIVYGDEKFGYNNLDRLTVTVPYDESRDVEFSKGEINELHLKSGDFLITYPNDAHIPNMVKLNKDTMVRAVAKIRI